MARGEHQAEEIVVERVVGLRGEVGSVTLAAPLELARELLRLAIVDLRPAQAIDRAVPADGHEPGARVVRDARLGPLLERGDERLLREVLREPDVAHDPDEAADHARRLDPPDGLDRAIDLACRHGQALPSVWLRICASRSRSSGVSSSPKSSVSNTGRISTTPSSPSGFGIRLTHSVASSSDLTCHSQ